MILDLVYFIIFGLLLHIILYVDKLKLITHIFT